MILPLWSRFHLVIVIASLLCGTATAQQDRPSDKSRAALAAELDNMQAASAAEAQKLVIEKFPEIGVAGSPENLMFRGVYNNYVSDDINSRAFQRQGVDLSSPNWPFKAAAKVARLGSDAKKALSGGTITNAEIFDFIYALTQDEVKTLFGAPSRVSEGSAGHEYWYYEDAALNPATEKKGMLKIEFKQGSVGHKVYLPGLRVYGAEVDGTKRSLSKADAVTEGFKKDF